MFSGSLTKKIKIEVKSYVDGVLKVLQFSDKLSS